MYLLLSILANLRIYHADPTQVIGGEPHHHTHTHFALWDRMKIEGHLGLTMGFLSASDGKESARNGGDQGLIPG